MILLLGNILKAGYFIGLNLSAIVIFLAGYSAHQKAIETTQKSYPDLNVKAIIKQKNEDYAELIIAGIKILFFILCPLVNLAVGITFVIYWESFRDEVQVRLEKDYINIILSSYPFNLLGKAMTSEEYI